MDAADVGDGDSAPARGQGAMLALEDAMFQVDPWEKAADCERALRITIDPVHRENLTNIREFWISLANARPFLSEHEFCQAGGNDWPPSRRRNCDRLISLISVITHS